MIRCDSCLEWRLEQEIIAADDRRERCNRRPAPVHRGLASRNAADVPDRDIERLLDRGAEVARIERALEAARSGSGGLLMIEGAAGIGKTCLLEAACKAAASKGLLVLRARGTDLEHDFPLGVVRQLIEPALRSRSLAAREEELAAAARLVARLAGGASTDGASPPADDPSFPTLYGLYRLLANLAERRAVCLVVDDVHWADTPSLRCLALLAPRLPDLGAFALLSVRPEERPDDTLLERIATGPSSEVRRLEPLSETAVGALIDAEYGTTEDDFKRACHAAVAGNPFYLKELLREVKREGLEPSAATVERAATLGPRGVGQAIRVRLTRLSGAAPAVARAVAVLEDAAPSEAVRLAGAPRAEALGAIDELIRSAILQRRAHLSFAHPIVRNAVYEHVAPSERSELHSRVAAILREDGAPLGRIAEHLLKADPAGDREVVALLRSAAEEAIARGAPEVAVTHLRRAVAEPPPAHMRGEVLLELGRASAATGDLRASIAQLGSAHDLASGPRERATVAVELARAMFLGGEFRAARALLEKAIGELGESDERLSIRLQAELIMISRADLSAPPLLSEGLASGVGTLSGEHPEEQILLALVAAERLRDGVPDEAVTLAERALGASGPRRPDQLPDALPSHQAVMVLASCDRLGLAHEHAEAAVADARARGSVRASAMATILRGFVLFRRGDVGAAERDAREGFDLTLRQELRAVMPLAAALLAYTLIERAEPEAAAELLECHGLSGELPGFDVFLPLLDARGHLSLARRDFRAALEDQLELRRRMDAWGCRNPALPSGRLGAALAYLGLGETAQARRLAAEEVRLARVCATPRAVGLALRAAGLLESGEQGIRLLREAVSHLKTSPARLEYARALIDLGAALRRANRRAEARTPLREGLETAHRCGARALVERGRVELNATGARPRRLALTGADALTPSERRVAQMAAEGLSNAELAQALFVTRKTVETHLGHAYRKLEVSSRADLASALGGAQGSAHRQVAV